MIGGVLSVIVIYLLVNLAQVVLGHRGGQIITVLSLISLPSMLNAIMMIGTRILFAMGRDGLISAVSAVSALIVTAGCAPQMQGRVAPPRMPRLCPRVERLRRQRHAVR